MKTRLLNKIAIASLFLGFSIQNNFAQWTQVGQNIYGDSTSNQLGFNVSMSADGQTIAAASPYSSHPGFGVGHVQIFKNIGGTWTQQGQHLIGDNQGDNFGYAISLNSNGNIIAITAPNHDIPLTNAGIVRIFENISGTWTQLGQDIVGSAAGDFSGQSVSLSSDGLTVAIGTIKYSSNRGQVRVYKYTGGTWVQQGSNVVGVGSQDQLGTCVSLSSDGLTFVTGLKFSTYDTLTSNGSAKVYEFDGVDWLQKGATIQGEAIYDNFGASADISSDGSIVAIGATKNDGTASNAGHVRVYEYSVGAWVQIGQDIDGEAINNEFGYSVSLNDAGTIVGGGSPKNYAGGTVAGHARIYENIGGNWIQKGIDIDGDTLNQSGWSVDLSGDGYTVVVGAPYCSDSLQHEGLAKVYEYTSPASIETNEKILDFNLYPNPVKSELTINYEGKIDAISVLDVTGKTIKSMNTTNTIIDVSDLVNGVYFMQVQTSKGFVTKAFIKE